MTREEIDALWYRAMRSATEKGDPFTRFEFAQLVAAAEREACARIADEIDDMTGRWIADAIRAREEA